MRISSTPVDYREYTFRANLFTYYFSFSPDRKQTKFHFINLVKRGKKYTSTMGGLTRAELL